MVSTTSRMFKAHVLQLLWNCSLPNLINAPTQKRSVCLLILRAPMWAFGFSNAIQIHRSVRSEVIIRQIQQMPDSSKAKKHEKIEVYCNEYKIKFNFTYPHIKLTIQDWEFSISYSVHPFRCLVQMSLKHLIMMHALWKLSTDLCTSRDFIVPGLRKSSSHEDSNNQRWKKK